MEHKKKNTRLDLLFILPGIIGSIGVCMSAVFHLINTPSPDVIGMMNWVFHVSLVMIVLELGFRTLGYSCDELKERMKK